MKPSMKSTCTKLNCQNNECMGCTAYYKESGIKILASYQINFETLEIKKLPVDDGFVR